MSVMTPEQARSYIVKLLTAMSQAGGSDLFISKDFPPSMKSQGSMKPLTSQKLTGEVTRELADALMNPRQREEFAKELECNFAMSVPERLALPRERVHAAAERRHGDPHDRQRDSGPREARPAGHAQGDRDDQARPGARRRRHRLRQVDLARRDDRSSQPHLRRPHRHRRRSGGVRAPVAPVADHASRSGHRHALAGTTR